MKDAHQITMKNGKPAMQGNLCCLRNQIDPHPIQSEGIT